jgi:diguanylate cyclase (GGDEF)-like protein
MISDSRVLGAIIIGFAETRGFSAEDIARAERAGRHASFAVAKMLLLEEERRRSEELEVLNRIGLAINADRDLEHLARTIFEQCRRVIRLDTFYLALYDEAREELAFPLFYDGGETVAMEPRSIRDRPGMSGYIIRARASLSIPDASLPEVQERYDVVRSGGIPSRAYIGVPLIYGDKVLGVLSVQNRNANEYAAHHVRLVETIAAQSAIAIENARLYGELQEMSITDGLTGAFNFRHLMELGPLEFAKASRLGRPLALLFLDIDRFHDFNARYGHATGNEVLKAVVNRARGCVRGIDIFARYGGEEFVIVLPEIPPAEAAVIAERVRSSIEALRVPAAPDGTTEAPEEGLSVTISVGLASATPELKDFEALVAAANAAERLAKERGRNRVEKAG